MPNHTEYVFYGLHGRPAAFTVPPVEATPDQPLPAAAPILRICAGAEEPATVLLRSAREMVGVWRHAHEHRPLGREELEHLNEQMGLYTWFIDREAGGHTEQIAHAPEAPTAPSSYGDWVSWLVRRYVLYALRQHDPDLRQRDSAELCWCIESLDELVGAVRAGRLRLREQATGPRDSEFPPRRVWPSTDTEPTASQPDGDES
ncbi:hypothetical protein [Nocardia vaccinii]|uniref:hypothetical protein n=1 Tax=Nocardia vaccinii TaxID=1822 RepID=UPI0008317300|nr:hypothetical protein [Nocardia vaccinii]